MQVDLRILRYDPERDDKPHWEAYTVESDPKAEKLKDYTVDTVATAVVVADRTWQKSEKSSSESGDVERSSWSREH